MVTGMTLTVRIDSAAKSQSVAYECGVSVYGKIRMMRMCVCSYRKLFGDGMMLVSI